MFRSSFRYSILLSSNNKFKDKTTFTSSFPSVASNLHEQPLTTPDRHNDRSFTRLSNPPPTVNIAPDEMDQHHPHSLKPQRDFLNQPSKKPAVNVALQDADDETESPSSSTSSSSSHPTIRQRGLNDSDEEQHSQFGEVLHERMRELKSEKHRDFKITTHIATRLPKVENEMKKPFASSLDEANDESFFSFFDDVESELQSGATSALNQLAALSATSFHQNSSGLGGGGVTEDGQPTSAGAGVMLSRAIARASFCSRRAALELVASGKVKIDGVIERDPFHRVQAHNDIVIEGHRGRLRFCAPRLWAFHKPSFVTVSKTSPNDKSSSQFSIWSRYSQLLGVDHLVPVGSMPTRCHGLLMLTNDGELARWLEHSSTRIQSTWIFRVRPAIDPVLAMKLNSKGVDIGGVRRREFQFINFTGGRSRHAIRVKVQAPEPNTFSNNSDARRNSGGDDDDESSGGGFSGDGSSHYDIMPVTQMLEAIDRRVLRGGRVGFGPFTLAGLPPGGIREVTVPPFYMKYVNPVWAPFVERDWPLFRRQRVQKLTRLARWRGLNDREQEEVEQFSCDELRRAFEESSKTNAAVSEIEAEAAQFAESVYQSEPDVEVDFEEAKKKTVNNSKMIQWKW